jgi:hypothetical protein
MSNRERRRPEDVFGFTERERLYDRIGHQRFLGLLTDEQTVVHSIELSSNSYGEFLFVLVSRPAAEQRVALTFWGLGYHEYREQWITGEWFWHQSDLSGGRAEQPMVREEVLSMIAERYQEVLVSSRNAQQSKRGQLFEMMADLTDDDGAISDMEDLGDWLLGQDDEDV